MTHPETKTAIDHAFSSYVERIFAVFVTRLRTEGVDDSIKEFREGLQFASHARELALNAADVKP